MFSIFGGFAREFGARALKNEKSELRRGHARASRHRFLISAGTILISPSSERTAGNEIIVMSSIWRFDSLCREFARRQRDNPPRAGEYVNAIYARERALGLANFALPTTFAARDFSRPLATSIMLSDYAGLPAGGMQLASRIQ